MSKRIVISIEGETDAEVNALLIEASAVLRAESTGTHEEGVRYLPFATVLDLSKDDRVFWDEGAERVVSWMTEVAAHAKNLPPGRTSQDWVLPPDVT